MHKYRVQMTGQSGVLFSGFYQTVAWMLWYMPMVWYMHAQGFDISVLVNIQEFSEYLFEEFNQIAVLILVSLLIPQHIPTYNYSAINQLLYIQSAINQLL